MNTSSHDVPTLTGVPLETQQLRRVIRSLGGSQCVRTSEARSPPMAITLRTRAVVGL